MDHKYIPVTAPILMILRPPKRLPRSPLGIDNGIKVSPAMVGQKAETPGLIPRLKVAKEEVPEPKAPAPV